MSCLCGLEGRETELVLGRMLLYLHKGSLRGARSANLYREWQEGDKKDIFTQAGEKFRYLIQ